MTTYCSKIREDEMLKCFTSFSTDAKLSSDPMPEPSDQTISDDQTRTAKLLPNDRQDLHVATDAKEPLSKMFEKLEALTRVREEERKIRLHLYRGNMLRDMVDLLLEKRREKYPHTTTSKWEAHKLFEEDSFPTEYGLDKKYHKMLAPGSIRKWSDERNDAAHKTHGEFAILLYASRHEHPEDYNFWKDLFPFCVEKTIEQLLGIEGVVEEEGDQDEETDHDG